MSNYGNNSPHGFETPYGLGGALSTFELQQLAHRVVGNLITFDGLPIAVTDIAGIAGTDFCGDGRTIVNGLRAPEAIIETDPLEGEFRDHRTTFTVVDNDEDILAATFKAKDPSVAPLVSTIWPYTDLSLVTAVHSKAIGTETIGPNGERHRYPFLPGIEIPQMHIGRDAELPDIGAARTSDNPVVMMGRRVAWFRVFRDWVNNPDDENAGWRPWSEAQRWWSGVMDDAGTVRRGVWQVQCSGPHAFLDKTLGLLGASEPVRINVPIDLSSEQGNNKRGIGVAFWTTDIVNQLEGPTETEYGSDVFTTEFSSTANTRAEFISELSAAIQATAAEPLPSQFNAAFGGVTGAGIGADGSLFIRSGQGDAAQSREAVMSLCLHEDVWRAMGYDPPNQSNPDLMFSDDYDPRNFIRFVQISDLFPFPPAFNERSPPPGPGYWSASLSTRTPEDLRSGNDRTDNNGEVRDYLPLYFGETRSLPADLGTGVEITMGFDTVRHPGQLDRPPAADPTDTSAPFSLSNGAGNVTRQGLWLCTGNRRVAGAEDAEEEAQILQCSWRDNDVLSPFSIFTDNDNLPRMVAMRWLDPGHYSIDRRPLNGGWAISDAGQPGEGGAVFAQPFFRLGYSAHDNPNRIDYTILRLLLSTGLSTGWTGYEGDPAAFFDQTSNEPSDLSLVTRDGEIADLGLGIPAEMVAPALEWATVFSELPQGSYLQDWYYGFLPGDSAGDLLRGIFKSLGLAWSFINGQFGVFDPIASVAPEDAVYTITDAQSVSELDPSSNITEQDIRYRQPIARFELSYSIDPRNGSPEAKLSVPSKAEGARYRSQGDRWKSTFPGQREITNDANGKVNSLPGWERRAQQIARRHETRDFVIRDHLVFEQAADTIGVGSPILWTDLQVVNQDGSYGITLHPGRVFKIHLNGAAEGGFVRTDAVVEADPIAEIVVCAPMAIANGYDTDTFQILCLDDHADIGGDHNDVEAFVESSLTNYGGNAAIEGYNVQRGTVDWTGSVASVTTSPGASRINLEGAITGTYYRDCDYVVKLRARALQPANSWPLFYFGVIGDDTGQDAAGNNSARWVL